MVLQNIKEGIEGRPVSWYSEVFDLIFPDLDKEKANKSRVVMAENKEKKEEEKKDGEESD